MVNFVLKIAGELENLSALQPQGGCDDPNFTYYVKLKCGNCGEVAPKDTCFSLNETLPSPSGKGYCHLVRKCKFCAREATVTMITGQGRPLTQAESESGSLVPLMVFECRNVEPIEFSFGDGWSAESIAGTKFEDIDLSGGDYADYDEKGKCPVMISNLRATFTFPNQK